MTRSLLTIALVFLFFSCSDNSDDSSSSNLTENPALEVTNSVEATTDENNFLDADDVLTYTISVKNTGDVTLNNISLTYNLSDNASNILSLDSSIAFVNSDADSSNGILLVDETATYTATYTITQTDVDAGGLSNSITANGISPQGESVSDISDDGDDTDGNLINDATTTLLSEPAIDSTIIAEYHILNSSGELSIKYIFDSNGQISKIMNSNNISYLFSFNTENQLTNITSANEFDEIIESQNVVYDSENRVISIGERGFEFVEGNPNYYIDLETVYEDTYTYEDIEYTEIRYTKLKGLYTCYYTYDSEFDTITQELTEYGFCFYYNSNDYNRNVNNDCNEVDCANFSHDSNTNPLYSTTNLIDLHYFLRLPISGSYNPLFNLYSENSPTLINYPIDPSSIAFSYTLNDNNLPVTSTRQYFDPGGSYPERAYGNYYYQGDTIPD